MGSMMFFSFKEDMILEPWLCRWVSFLTRTGPISILFFQKQWSLFDSFFFSGTRNSHAVYDIFWMEFYQSYECSCWVDIVLHCLLHTDSWFQGQGRRGFSRGCGEAPCAAILQKIRKLDIKRKLKSENKIRPTDPWQNLLCKHPKHTYFLALF